MTQDENQGNENLSDSQTTITNANENLIHLKEKNEPVTQAKDLNAKLSELESTLTHLNAREAATNKAFRELHSETRKHTENQSAKLDEMHEQLKNVKESYNELSNQALQLAADTNVLSITVDENHDHFNQQLESVEQHIENHRKESEQQILTVQNELNDKIQNVGLQSENRDRELAEEQYDLRQRATAIENRARQLGEDLETRVNVINTTIQALEKQLTEQIQTVARQSEERDEILHKRTDDLTSQFNETTAKLKNNDEILFDRTESLEISSKRLSEESADLQQQTQVLDGRADILEDRSDALEDTAEQHQTHIGKIYNRINQQFRGFSAALLLLAITLLTVGIYQTKQWDISENVDQALDAKITTQQAQIMQGTTQLQQLETRTASRDSALMMADSKLEKADKELETAMKAADADINAVLQTQQQQIVTLQQQLATLDEQTQSTNGRLTAMQPYRQFGRDNVLHNAQWLQQQPADTYLVKIRSADKLAELHKTLNRYSYYLNDHNVAYFTETTTDGTARYALVYGPFDNDREALEISRKLPVMQARFQSEIIRTGDIAK